MSRPITVSEAQDQLLETALALYRLCYRLHRHREGLRIPCEITHQCHGENGIANVTPTIELVVAGEIGITIDELVEIADRLQRSARATDVSVRRRWRQERMRCGS